MREAEARGLAFLFKLRLTANVKRMIEKLTCAREWINAGQGFEAKVSAVRLMGWSRQRRVDRAAPGGAWRALSGFRSSDDDSAPQLAFVEIGDTADFYEYSVLVTSLDEETEAFGQALSRPGRRREYFRRDEEPMGLGRLHDARAWRVAGSRPGCSRCFTTGGTSSSVSPIPASTARRSETARCS